LFATHIETLFGVEERVQFRLPDEVILAAADKKLQEIGT